MSVMTSFKRKRIEKWCEDVAQYLHDGTICKTVIGNVAEDIICGSAFNGPIRTGLNGDNISENILENFALINNKNAPKNTSGLTISTKNLNAKVDLAFKKASQVLIPSDISGLVTDGVANGDGSVNIGGSFPVVKFAYSHYHEQRRKIDRLVQGLPVLNANGVASVERPSSKSSTEDHVPIIIVNGEEPVRSSHTRSSSQPRKADNQSRYTSRGSGPPAPTNSNYLQQIQTSTTAPRRSGEVSARPVNHLHRSASGNKLFDSRLNNQNPSVSVDPSVNLTANDRVSRIKTAPVPNRNLHRARQRILSRRGNRVLEHTSQIPLQNCWALAELTW